MAFLIALCAWEKCNGILYPIETDEEQEILCMKCGNSTVFNPQDEDDESEG